MWYKNPTFRFLDVFFQCQEYVKFVFVDLFLRKRRWLPTHPFLREGNFCSIQKIEIFQKKKKLPTPSLFFIFQGAPYFTRKNSQVYNFEAQQLVGFVSKWFLLFPFGSIFRLEIQPFVLSGAKRKSSTCFYHRGASRRVSRCRWFRWHAQSIRPPGHCFRWEANGMSFLRSQIWSFPWLFDNRSNPYMT